MIINENRLQTWTTANEICKASGATLLKIERLATSFSIFNFFILLAQLLWPARSATTQEELAQTKEEEEATTHFKHLYKCAKRYFACYHIMFEFFVTQRRFIWENKTCWSRQRVLGSGPALSQCNRCRSNELRASGGPAPWCLGRLFIFARYSLLSRIVKAACRFHC